MVGEAYTTISVKISMKQRLSKLKRPSYEHWDDFFERAEKAMLKQEEGNENESN